MPPSSPEIAKVRMPAVRLPGAASRARQPRSSPIRSPSPQASATRDSNVSSSLSILSQLRGFFERTHTQ